MITGVDAAHAGQRSLALAVSGMNDALMYRKIKINFASDQELLPFIEGQILFDIRPSDLTKVGLVPADIQMWVSGGCLPTNDATAPFDAIVHVAICASLGKSSAIALINRQ